MHQVNKLILCLGLVVAIAHNSYSQGMGMPDNPAYKQYFDSLRTMDYPYTFPILGAKAYKRGYDLQHAWGVSPVFFTQSQEIIIDRILIGFNGSERVDVSDFIRFGPTLATTYAYTVRPDLWVLPFLNIYGILGFGTTETEVTLVEPVLFETNQFFRATSAGIGATLAGALGPVFAVWDNNFNFASIDVLVEPVPAFNSSIRIGHTIRAPYKPEKSLSIWGGAFYQSLKNDTDGSIPLTDVFPGFGEGAIIDELRDWAATLPPAQRIIVNQIIDKLEDISNGIDPGNAVVDYTLDKKVAGPINLIFGAQYQVNKRWIVRTELGVFGKRSQFLLNLNYRFPGFNRRER